ncbi:MAG TPA: hypothetical protein VK638_57130 [Edaphobacter sp.]|nr:hypothetical protein [Edaphobacter sp.]
MPTSTPNTRRFVRRKDDLRRWLAVDKGKRSLPQLRTLLRCDLCSEVWGMKDGVHYRTSSRDFQYSIRPAPVAS